MYLFMCCACAGLGLGFEQLKLFVLDEADQMLDKGFKEMIYEIFSMGLPKATQVNQPQRGTIPLLLC